MTSVLYYGDNLDVLRRHVPDESVDLVYLDPPFKSDKDYNVLFKEQDGARATAQIKAFEDTWTWDSTAARTFQEAVERGGEVANALLAFRQLLNQSDMLAYLAMMAPRLVELRRVMKSTATIYLHCDSTASAHLRLLMDCVFGHAMFLNEIVWHYQTSSGAPKKKLLHSHDVILRYAKEDPDSVKWHHPKLPWPETTLRKWQRDPDGRIYRVQNKFNKRYYIDPEGKLDGDVWEITLSSRTAERLGYPTQKPEELLEKIIRASTDEGDTVLDPFCGCGTTIAVAQRLHRRWIGIDITHVATGLIKSRLLHAFGPSVLDEYEVVGEPVSLEDARQLASDDPFQFQAWALGLVGARLAGSSKRGADQGIDGRLYFHDEPQNGTTKQIILSVKGGHPTVAHVRDLIGVLTREHAQIGVLITFEEPTGAMRKEAASAGFYTSPWGNHPRVQLLTVHELLDGKRIDYPPAQQANVTFKKARPASGPKPKLIRLGLDDAFDAQDDEPDHFDSDEDEEESQLRAVADPPTKYAAARAAPRARVPRKPKRPHDE